MALFISYKKYTVNTLPIHIKIAKLMKAKFRMNKIRCLDNRIQLNITVLLLMVSPLLVFTMFLWRFYKHSAIYCRRILAMLWAEGGIIIFESFLSNVNNVSLIQDLFYDVPHFNLYHFFKLAADRIYFRKYQAVVK